MERRRTSISRAIILSDGRLLHAREWPGEGAPIVFLPGLFDSSDGWRDLALRSRRPCLAVDLPGFGRSSPSTRPRLSAFAEDVVEGLRELGVQGCTLVGHSLGGGVATAVAERMPEEVEALVLCAPVGFGRVPLAELVALPLMRRVAAMVVPQVLSKPFLLRLVYTDFVTYGVRPTEELTSRLAADSSRVRPGLPAAIEAVAVAGRSPQAFHRRAVGYHGPVSVVWGERDTVVPPAHRHGVAAALPQAGIHLWPGMGHHPQRERPALLSRMVERAGRGAGAERRGTPAADRAGHPRSRPRRAPVRLSSAALEGGLRSAAPDGALKWAS